MEEPRESSPRKEKSHRKTKKKESKEQDLAPTVSQETTTTTITNKPKRVSALRLDKLSQHHRQRSSSSSNSNSKGENEVLDYSPKESRRTTTPPDSGERMLYTEYLDGLRYENKRPFGTPKFCFICDKEEKFLLPRVRISGEKYGPDSPGRMIPVYRQLFICPPCEEKYKDERKVVMSLTAHAAYFQ